MDKNKITLSKKNIDEFVRFVIHDAETIDFHISCDGISAEIQIVFDEEKILLREGDCLLRTNDIIPRTIPAVHKYKVINSEESEEQ